MKKKIAFPFSLLVTTIVSYEPPLSSQAVARAVGKNSNTASAAQAKSSVSATHRKHATTATQAKGTEALSVSVRRRSPPAHILVSKASIERLAPGMNPLAALNQSPGINFQSADAQGTSTWSTQIFMHGFSQSDLGITLDDMPLGEITYRNYNGVNPTIATAPENVAGIDVSQSAGAEEVAASNNLGGSLAYRTIDPAHKLGASVQQGFGSYSNYHTYVRVDSGDLNSTGTRFYVSYVRNDQQKWKGFGEQFSQQASAKLIQPIAENSSLSTYFNYYDLHSYEYQDMSPEILQKLGNKIDNYYNGKASGYLAAVNAAKGIYPSGYNKLSDPEDASYYDSPTNEHGFMGYVKSDLALTDRLKWVTTAYGHADLQQTGWTSPYFSSPNGSPLSELMKEPSFRRFGILSKLTYDIARNHIGMGVWYENNSYQSPMYAYQQPSVVNGQIMGNLVNPLQHQSNPFAEIFNQNYNSNTFTAFVNDTYRPIQNLALHFGFKSLLSTQRVGDGYLSTAYYGTSAGDITSGESLTTAKAFLPHIGVDYRFLKNHEIFIDISENARNYMESGYKLSASPFAVTQAAYDASRGSIRPEKDWTYAIGYRYSDRLMDASVYAYRTNFFNRLQQITSGPVINPVSAVANVGSVTMNGVDVQFVIRPVRNLSISNSISYNHAVYDNNITQQGTIYRTKGQQVVNYPRFMYKANLAYDWRSLSFYIEGNYLSHRNYDYSGELHAPGYWLANLGLQWHVKKPADHSPPLGGFVKGLTLAFNLNNITNQTYIATMGENGNPLDSSSGYSYQSMLLGMPRTAFGSIKADF
ncbi:TonB-dependent receptor [Acetobacter aceti]|uniref:TonB-dependent receptor n=1 Tax=Acetobacter aceti TaxID=435 RepID=UPI000C06B3CB|nr:TonB-dependent receptor [Acetobacter aceti]